MYTTASLGGYGEALLIGNLILLLGWRLVEEITQADKAGPTTRYGAFFALWGFLAGLGFWADALSLVYAVPVGVFILWRLFSRAKNRGWIMALVLMLAGALIGTLPWWIYAAQNGLHALVTEIFGQAVAVEQGSYLKILWDHFLSLVLLGFPVILGLRPPWSAAWLGLPLIPFILIAWGLVIFTVGKIVRDNPGKKNATRLIAAIIGLLMLAFELTSFGVDPSGRYFLPVTVLLALLAGLVLDRWIAASRYATGVVLLLVVFQVYGNVQCASTNPPGFTTQFYEPARVNMSSMDALIQFLDDHNLTRGYSNYWVSYPLDFLSRERIIFTPELPYHLDLRYTSRDNRYLPYNALVDQSQDIAYITSKNPALDARLQEGFTKLDIRWNEETIGDFNIYYNLSAPVRPAEIDLSPRQ